MDVGDSFTTFRDYWKRWKLLETLKRHFLLFLHPLKVISLSLSHAVSSFYLSTTVDNFLPFIQSQQRLIHRYLHGLHKRNNLFICDILNYNTKKSVCFNHTITKLQISNSMSKSKII